MGGATTFLVGGAVVHPTHKGTGPVEDLLRALGEVASAHGLDRVVALVRPTRKDLYPLVPIEDYLDGSATTDSRRTRGCAGTSGWVPRSFDPRPTSRR